jgi:Na+-translocating ferredoxin:NAD+ oxidoreductase RnfD subunit
MHDHPDMPPWFAAALAVLVDGAIVQAAIFNSTQPVDAARAAVGRLLELSPT